MAPGKVKVSSIIKNMCEKTMKIINPCGIVGMAFKTHDFISVLIIVVNIGIHSNALHMVLHSIIAKFNNVYFT